jgi:hypothetical protein
MISSIVEHLTCSGRLDRLFIDGVRPPGGHGVVDPLRMFFAVLQLVLLARTLQGRAQDVLVGLPVAHGFVEAIVVEVLEEQMHLLPRQLALVDVVDPPGASGIT